MPNNILSTAVATKKPLIITGNEEGIIDVIDKRDGQNVQRIFTGETNRCVIWLLFLSDTLFVSLSDRGTISFYSSGTPYQSDDGPFMKTEHEDQLLIAQGLD